MDREISHSLVQKRRFRNISLIILGLVLLTVVFFAFRKFLTTSLSRSTLRIAPVEVGIVENTFTAVGQVIPAFELVMTSPIRASIKQTLFSAGAKVQTGQAIVILDKALTQLEFEKLEGQLSLKRNGISKLQMQLDKELYDAEIENQIKTLTINRLRSQLEDTRRLFKVGGRTQEDVQQAENGLKIAELEKKQLENNLQYKRKSMESSVREVDLSAQIESKNLAELSHKLKMADIVADRPGVLTWVNDKIGSSVNEGDILARLADLRSFRIEGSASDVYANQVTTGLPVIVRINETDMRGMIVQVRPAVENNVVKFEVQLEDDKNSLLRPNMKVEIFIVTQRSPNTLRVANGPAFSGRQVQQIFVMENGVAKRREVEIGLSNFDFVEIKRGLKAGEKVIVSDLSRWEYLSEITLK